MDPTCDAPGCDLAPALSWQRDATDAEREQHGIPEGETALILVLGCATHRISYDLAAGIHESTCAAPPACDCDPRYGAPGQP